MGRVPVELKVTRGEKRYYIDNTNIMKIKVVRDEQILAAGLEQESADTGNIDD